MITKNIKEKMYLENVEEIELELTGVCNLKCPLCTRNYSHAKHQLVSNQRPLTEIINQLDKYPNLKHINIAGTVSEPTLYKDIIPLMEYLVKRNLSIDFYSNASILNFDLWGYFGKLFIKPEQRVIFTICGSTQELHEKYRKGSLLQNVLLNARWFSNNNESKSDWMQYIVFDYNEEDSKSEKTLDILNSFSNVMIVGSEGKRRINEYNKNFDNDIIPVADRKLKIDTIFKRGETLLKKKSSCTIDCKSFKQKRIYIDQFGKVFACYNLAEYYPDQFFIEEFDNAIKKYYYSFEDIFSFKNNDCFKCEKSIIKLMEIFDVDFVC
jgi:MoaA/NifB/PqqE/SkfB family radical SAM enzyme